MLEDPFITWLSGFLVGYPRELLRIVITTALAGRNMLLAGNHGLGKSRLARAISSALNLRFVEYDCSKTGVIEIAGLPDPAELARGRLAFVHHENTIWDKEVVLLEELSRMSKESSNIFLELLEQRTLYGRPLPCRFFISTSNPEAYASCYSLDAALVDRFAVVWPVPDGQDSKPPLIEQMVRANLEIRPSEEAPATVIAHVRDLGTRMKECRSRLLKEPSLLQSVAAWIGKFVHLLLGEKPKAQAKSAEAPIFVSPRTFAHHLPHVLLDLLSHALANDGVLTPERLAADAALAIRGTIASKVDLPEGVLDDALRQSRDILLKWKGLDSSREEDLLRGLSEGEPPQRIEALRALDIGRLGPQDLPRLDAAARKLVLDVLGTPEHAEWGGPLWTALGPLPEVRRTCELVILRRRIGILQDLYTPQLLEARRHRLAKPDEPNDLALDWAPDSPPWR